MSDFPDDVMKLAMQAAQGMGFEAVRVQPDVSPIAKAILAERERCADVAMNEAERARRNGCTSEAIGALWVRNAIRLGSKAPA